MWHAAVPDMHDDSSAILEKSLEDSEIAAGGLGVDLLKVARLAGGASEAPGGVEEGVGSGGCRGERNGGHLHPLAGQEWGLAAGFHGQAACSYDQRARLKRQGRRRMAGGAPASVLLLGVHHQSTVRLLNQVAVHAQFVPATGAVHRANEDGQWPHAQRKSAGRRAHLAGRQGEGRAAHTRIYPPAERARNG